MHRGRGNRWFSAGRPRTKPRDSGQEEHYSCLPGDSERQVRGSTASWSTGAGKGPPEATRGLRIKSWSYACAGTRSPEETLSLEMVSRPGNGIDTRHTEPFGHLHLECLSHRAEERMSHSRMVPLLLLYTNTLHCSGWNSAAVITSVSSSMFTGLMSTMSAGAQLRQSARRASVHVQANVGARHPTARADADAHGTRAQGEKLGPCAACITAPRLVGPGPTHAHAEPASCPPASRGRPFPARRDRSDKANNERKQPLVQKSHTSIHKSHTGKKGPTAKVCFFKNLFLICHEEPIPSGQNTANPVVCHL